VTDKYAAATPPIVPGYPLRRQALGEA
jgi:hypothetical protein